MQSITCTACGALIRATRRSCLRCGAVLNQTIESVGSSPSIPWTAFAAAAVLVLTGVASLYMREHDVANGPASPHVLATTNHDPVRPEPASASVDPGVLALDANRAGAVAYGRGEIVGALSQFEAAVAANPMDPVALNNLGQALVRDGRVRDALEPLDRAVSLNSGQWAYHFNRARAHALLEDWPLAVEGYREAARLFPDDYVTEYNLARALRAAGNLDEAIAGFERAIALAPGQADFHLSHGLALEAAARPRDAAAAYRRYLELEPDAADVGKIAARAEYLERAPAAPLAR